MPAVNQELLRLTVENPQYIAALTTELMRLDNKIFQLATANVEAAISKARIAELEAQLKGTKSVNEERPIATMDAAEAAGPEAESTDEMTQAEKLANGLA